MVDKFNRAITFSLRTVEGADVGDIIFEAIAQENANRLPLEISANISKTFTSGLDSCSLTVVNDPIIEQFYIDKDLIYNTFSQNDLRLSASCGYGNDTWPIFTGDMQNFSISGGNSLTEQALTIQATSGQRTLSRGRIKQKFPVGTTYFEIVLACFEVLFAEFGVELTEDRLIDPEGKLDTEIIKPKTLDSYATKILADICRQFDFTWGIGHADTALDPQKAYFSDKRGFFPLAVLCDQGPHDVSYQTGLIGLPAFQKNSFSFTHLPDKCLNIGTLVNLDVRPQINTNQIFEGRINDIQININNKSGAFTYDVTCQFFDVGEQLAILDKQKVNDGGEVL